MFDVFDEADVIARPSAEICLTSLTTNIMNFGYSGKQTIVTDIKQVVSFVYR